MKIAVAQVDASLSGSGRRFQWLDAQVQQAADETVDLIVFPELFMSGYNVGEALHRCAEPQNGPFTQRVRSLAKDRNIAIAYGYPERDGDAVYNSAILIDQYGRTLAHHRKTVLPIGSERDWFATGSGFSLFRFGNVTIAMVICYECEFPEIVRGLDV